MTSGPSFEDRLAALENRSIGLRDLPLAALQSKLELDWRPAAGVLLGDASITPAMLTAASVRVLVSSGHDAGPAPIAKTVVTSGGPLLVYFAGSAYLTAGVGFAGYQLDLDGIFTGFESVRWVNELNSYKTTVPTLAYLPAVVAGSHVLRIRQAFGTSNADARFSLTAIELSR